MNELFSLTRRENSRERDTLNLIASENYPSPKVLELLGSIWNTKYAEGYPGKRYYAGNIYADQLEEFVISKALEIFDKTGEYGVNVQVLSGSPANAMVYFSVLQPGDTVLSLDLSSGGHLSHMHPTSTYLKFFNYENYSLTNADDEGYEIDIEDFTQKIEELSPRIVVIGFSSYPKKIEFERLCKIAHQNGALVLADISHISGLVAVGKHSSPFAHNGSGADFVVTTTHKTLRGPRSALLFAKKEYMDAINRTVFPGTSGGPHLNQIAAVGQSLLEVSGEDVYPDQIPFGRYIEGVIRNTKALEDGLIKSGMEVVTKTQNHLVLIRLPESIHSLELQNNLESSGIITNRNTIPNDVKSAWVPGGLRLGTAALSSRGLDQDNAYELGTLIGRAVKNNSFKDLKDYSKNLSDKLAWWYEEI